MPGHYGQKPALSNKTLAELDVELEERFGKLYGDEDGKKYHQVAKDNGLFDLYLIEEASTEQKSPGRGRLTSSRNFVLSPVQIGEHYGNTLKNKDLYLMQLRVRVAYMNSRQPINLSIIRKEMEDGMLSRLMLLLLPRDGKDRMRMPIQAAWLCMILRQIKPVRYRRIYSL